jgi:site-specific DNA recombinase
VESGGLDIEQRGHGSYGQLTAKGLPRDGGLADLLAEAHAPQPRFAAVVVEDTSGPRGTPTTPSNWNGS